MGKKKPFSVKEVAKKLAVFVGMFSFIMVVSQDVQLFPGALAPLLSTRPGDAEFVPTGVESTFTDTSDGETIEVWYKAPEVGTEVSGHVAIIAHGNGGSMGMFINIQRWLSAIGVKSYAFDYRGFGRSSGWPSEEGIYADTEAVWKLVQEREQISAEKLIVIGMSVGAGPAAYMANKHQSGTLLLLSPYISIPEVVKDRIYLAPLTPLLWYEFPVAEYVGQLASTCLIVAHGERDTIIAPYHSDSVAKAYRGTAPLINYRNPEAGHNDLFWRSKHQLTEKLRECGVL